MTTRKTIRSDTNSFLSVKDDINQAANRYTSEGKCIIGKPAAIPQFSLNSYDEMKSLYFDQNKQKDQQTTLSGEQIQTNPVQSVNLEQGNIDHLYYITGSYTIGSDLNVKKAGVIFVDGNLTINTNITQKSNTDGLVFLVKGDVNIKDSVTEVNAFIITWGQFCSAWTGSFCPTPPYLTSQLIINGSIISLDSTKKPSFVRRLINPNANKKDPAEKIIFQPKYLAILKNIFARDLSVWSEIE